NRDHDQEPHGDPGPEQPAAAAAAGCVLRPLRRGDRIRGGRVVLLPRLVRGGGQDVVFGAGDDDQEQVVPLDEHELVLEGSAGGEVSAVVRIDARDGVCVLVVGVGLVGRLQGRQRLLGAAA